jgi:hypothetical protein
VKEAVACFADGADYVCFYDIGGAVAVGFAFADHGCDLVDGLIERGANAVVHCGVDYYENFVAIAFDVEDAHEQDTRRADDGAAWLQDQATS